MKIRLVVMAGILAAFLGSGFIWASEKGYAEKEAVEEGREKLQMPETVSGIWGEIKDNERNLGEIVQSGKLAEVHKGAFRIRDLVNALAEKSASLVPENLENVRRSAVRVAEIADLLDQYGDADDKVKTADQFARLEKLLQYIQAQYPQGALAQKEGIVYACPMHPKAKQDKPGVCQECGMALEAVKISPPGLNE